MSSRNVIVDGSNLATEGRSLPSLAQLDHAVREYLAENPDDIVTVVVDASFGHRIDPSEVAVFEGAEAAGEVISPPAGAIGRGDAFLLRIAEKTGATVLSNDSFQEFHGEHPWLFDKGRLIGGKPVPGVGWIFMERTPVRGPKSREVVKDAKRKKQAQLGAEGPPEATGLDLAASRSKGRGKKIDRAIARATEEVVAPKSAKPSRRRRGGAPPAEPVNDPLPFITFIADHPLGSSVLGVVAEYASHGVFVEADGNKCYVPLSAMGEPPPRRARDVVTRGEERVFVVQALDPLRRGIELGIPGFAQVTGVPTAETVEAEIHPEQAVKPERQGPSMKRRRARGADEVGAGSALEAAAAAAVAPVTKAAKAAKAAKKATAAAAKKVAAAIGSKAAPARAKKAAPAEKAAATRAAGEPAKKTAPKKAVAKKAVPKKAVPKKAVPKKSATPAAAKKAAGSAAAQKAAGPAPAQKAAGPAPAQKAAPAKKAASPAVAKQAAAPTAAGTKVGTPGGPAARKAATGAAAPRKAATPAGPAKKAGADKAAAAPGAKAAATPPAKKAAPTRRAPAKKVAAPNSAPPPGAAGGGGGALPAGPPPATTAPHPAGS